ncbi:MAG: nitrous oxide reductase family maturation protein NosD [Rhodothermales bacterium]|nr:nitrous oxide reductase family maturation protein NosD [Rhodothermales bacterium]MBO6780024.1 nitrous oxide reductase family maturation protein NosD [Rhodothermales bacterium]
MLRVLAIALLLAGSPGPAQAPERASAAPQLPQAQAVQAPERADAAHLLQTRAVQAGLSLAARVAAAAPGDTLRVAAGTYMPGTMRIARPLTLIGQDWPVIDGQGEHGLLEITADNVTVKGFVFTNTGTTFMEDRAAVKFTDSSECEVARNRFENTFFGVYLARASNCTVSHNVFTGTPDREVNGGNAVHAWYSDSLTVVGNRISGHRDGIYLEFTTDGHVESNTSSDNLRYGLHFMFSDRCAYVGNEFERNGAGVAVMYADQVRMERNRFRQSWGPSAFGLLLKEIKGGSLIANTFEANSVALHVESTDRMEVTGNHFTRNGWAVRVMADAQDNVFNQNVFLGNTFDVSTNGRKTRGSSFHQNYWDRYRGYDLDRDGWGDQPFYPVKLYAVLVERQEPALVLLGSAFVSLLDAMERALPLLTPVGIVDESPAMNPTEQP